MRVRVKYKGGATSEFQVPNRGAVNLWADGLLSVVDSGGRALEARHNVVSVELVEVTAYDAADAVDQARLEVGEGAKVLGVHPKPPRKVEGFQQITAWVAAGRSFLTGQLVSQRQFVVRESLLEGEALDFVFRDSRATEDVVVTVSRRVVEDLRLNLGEIVLDEAKKFIAS